MNQACSDQFRKWLRPRRQHRVLIDDVEGNQTEHGVDPFGKFPGIGDVEHIVTSTSRAGRLRFLKEVASQRNEVVIGSFAIAENLCYSTESNQVVIAEQPDILPTCLFKTLQEVRIRPDVLSIPDVTNLQPAGNKIFHDCCGL